MGSKHLIDKRAIIICIDSADRYRQLTSNDLESLDDQGLLPSHHRDCLGPARTDIGRHGCNRASAIDYAAFEAFCFAVVP